MKIDLRELTVLQRTPWLQHAIAPRPIALVSSIDKNGNVNLSPFSFFNLFSTNPPVVVFSALRRVRDHSEKDTLKNVLEFPEVVINVVDVEMVQQVSLASCEFATGVNEFVKAGFTEEASSMVKPPLVKESKVKFECKVLEVKPLGNEGGAGNLVICEVLCMHVDETVLNEEKTMIDQRRLHHAARLGGDWYSRVDATNLFMVEKPNTLLGIGIDAMPEAIRNSNILTGNNLGQLANVHEYPAVDASYEDERLKNIFQYFSVNPTEMDKELHKYAKELLDAGKVNEAWQVLLADD
ncbi:MAG: flavin reductase family protein [Lacibacter sp.]